MTVPWDSREMPNYPTLSGVYHAEALGESGPADGGFQTCVATLSYGPWRPSGCRNRSRRVCAGLLGRAEWLTIWRSTRSRNWRSRRAATLDSSEPTGKSAGCTGSSRLVDSFIWSPFFGKHPGSAFSPSRAYASGSSGLKRAIEVYGAGDGNRTHVPTLGLNTSACNKTAILLRIEEQSVLEKYRTEG